MYVCTVRRHFPSVAKQNGFLVSVLQYFHSLCQIKVAKTVCIYLSLRVIKFVIIVAATDCSVGHQQLSESVLIIYVVYFEES